MVKCCVCGNKNKDKQRGVRFHRVPINANIRAVWLQQLGLSALTSEDICSDHFAFTDYENAFATDRTRLRIKSDAVPKVKVIWHTISNDVVFVNSVVLVYSYNRI